MFKLLFGLIVFGLDIWAILNVWRNTRSDGVGVPDPDRGTDFGVATHFAMATPLTQEQVLAIAAREGWPAKYRKRGGMFGVVEMWIEGRQMMEVLSPQMQAEYLAAMREMAPAEA